jgi:hypothetical protein
MNGKQLIRTHAKASIAKSFGQSFQVADIFFQAIEKNKIIAATVHLGKGYVSHIGVLEYWNIGILERWTQHSISPLLHLLL